MTEKHEDIREFLENLPDEFDILEVGIDIQTQMEYIDYSHSFGRGELSEKETTNLGNILLDTMTELEAKKKILTILAHLGTITAFREIEKYYRLPDQELNQWTALALQECKMFLESTLTDQNIGFISSGLGGRKDKLRYYFLVLSPDKPFTEIQKRIIKEEYNRTAKDLRCIIEEIKYSDTFLELIVLVPMDVAIGTFIETGINKCNELGNFLFEHYYATNMEIPDRTKISDIIKKVKE